MNDRPPATMDALERHIDEAMLADRHGLRRRLRALRRRQEQGEACERLQATLTARIEDSRRRARERASRRPQPRFDDSLPIAEKREQIARAIEAHPVVIVCGETGSGKTTQLPKICLELGRGVKGLIGHTQPRRIAARSVAARIARELDSEPGGHVGYKVRFKDRVHAHSYIKLMTDGILLAETQGDRFLDQYDTLIIDEAHERSLNIDFLLGYLKQLLPRRPELKLIITSATIDPERFARHFDDAPVIEVSGRTYPVEIRYRPPFDEGSGETVDTPQAILEAIDELSLEGPGDVLVFLSGEREIRETAEALRKHHPPQTEILPLYARLGAAEQNRVFQPHAGRRIILATNVAETSLTVPGIRYVVDTGYARLSRYSYRAKVQRLPIEKISRASADQRAGRCGRVRAGVCVRLYDESDYAARPRYTEPEIRRTNLAKVILQMQSLRLGVIEEFPFLDPPDARFIKDGYRLLQELQAMDDRGITALGRRMARLPVDPRIGRMVLAAGEFACLKEVLVIASALSIQDPRERPLEKRQQADAAHARFAHEHSDFMTYLKLWAFYNDRRRHLSRAKLRKLCRQNFLSHVRMEEWRDIHSQLAAQAGDLGLSLNERPAEYANIHMALLAGLLSHVGVKTGDHEYTGARNRRFHIFPGSALAKKPPKWIMAAALVETTRLYAHGVARIEAEWLERLGAHLIKRSYADPHWEKRPARVAAFETLTLYGLTVSSGRKVHYGPIDPARSRELFIQDALVAGEYRSDAPFFQHNRRLVRELQELEHRSRRHDILVDDATLYDFYDRHLPADIYSGKGFEAWYRRASREEPKLLFLDKAALTKQGAGSVTEDRYPKSLSVHGNELKLGYHFEPGHPADGVTVTIPLALLNTLQPGRFEWLVPGLLEEKITTLIKSLPKSLRRHFVPAPEYARACMEALRPDDRPLLPALAARLKKMSGVEIPAGAWRGVELPAHLRMNFKVTDARGRVLDSGRDLRQLQERFRDRARERFASPRRWDWEREGVTDWDFGELPGQLQTVIDGVTIQGWPALVDRRHSIALKVMERPEQARAATPAGLRRLFRLRLAQQVKTLQKGLPDLKTLCLHYACLGRCEELQADLVDAVLDRSFLDAPETIRDRTAFEARLEQGRPRLGPEAAALCRRLAEILEAHTAVRKILNDPRNPPPAWAVQDIGAQLDGLVFPGFVLSTPAPWLDQLPRYLKAVQRRLDKLKHAPGRDQDLTRQLAPLWQRYQEACEKDPSRSESLAEYRWMLEELRVSLFAQELKTLMPVSVKRLEKLWRRLNEDGAP